MAVLLLSFSPAGPALAANRFYIENQTVHVGDTDVSVPVKLDNDAPRLAFSLSIKYDQAKMSLKAVEVSGTAADGALWSAGTIHSMTGIVYWSVIRGFNQGPPGSFDINKTIPAGTGLTAARLVFDVLAASPMSTFVALQDGLVGDPTVPDYPVGKNLLTDGLPTVPLLGLPGQVPAGTAVITISPAVTSTKFIRGDSNCSGEADISDAVHLLTFTFLGGEAPCCPEAADVNDDGNIADTTDAIVLLSHLFLGETPPPPPFPGCGEAAGVQCPGHKICNP
ncbi:MAG: hypothetical protein HY717_18315 [Planctomycetes bacterium]|nr:hypothetical protein [Planctomycetota bacterium]